MNGLNINNIPYVDNTTLLVNSNQDFQKFFDVVKSTSEHECENDNDGR